MDEPGSPRPMYQVPGPPLGWRPMSGLAITAFVLSVVLGLPAIFWWWLAVVPLALAVFAVLQAVPARFRGRGFAIAGLVTSLLFGSCSYVAQASVRSTAVGLAEQLLLPLAATDLDEAERDHRLKDWVEDRAVEDGRLETFKARFALVVERMGPYQGRVRSGSTFSGLMTVMVGPMDPTLAQVDDEDATAANPVLAYWSVASFEKGEVPVAVFFDTQRDSGKVMTALESGSKVRVVSDLRFYLPRP